MSSFAADQSLVSATGALNLSSPGQRQPNESLTLAVAREQHRQDKERMQAAAASGGSTPSKKIVPQVIELLEDDEESGGEASKSRGSSLDRNGI